LAVPVCISLPVAGVAGQNSGEYGMFVFFVFV